jgi:hypothetical protein
MPTRPSYCSTPQVRGPADQYMFCIQVPGFAVFTPSPRPLPSAGARPLMFTALPGDTHLKAEKQLQAADRN